jgi:Fe-S cluster assembly iron-binding protein IscA
MIQISKEACSEIAKVIKEKGPEGTKAVRVYILGYG